MLLLNANKNGRNVWHRSDETGKTAPNLGGFFFFPQFYFIYLVLAVLGLDCCPGDPLLEESRGYSLAVVWFLVVVASLVAERGF